VVACRVVLSSIELVSYISNEGVNFVENKIFDEL
jgi:hypothetical protein